MKIQIRSLILFLMLLPVSCMNMDELPPANFDPAYQSGVSDPEVYVQKKNAIATVTADQGKVIIILSDNERRFPVNWNLSLPSEPYRAIVEYTEVKTDKDIPIRQIYIYWLEPIETGAVLGSVDLYSPSESDPLEIVNDEFTSVEGGFLTIHYRINTSGKIPHSFSIAPASGENPYDIVLLHNAYGDTPVNSEEGLVAFPLGWLPSGEENVKLKVTYRDLDNKLSTLQFEYGT